MHSATQGHLQQASGQAHTPTQSFSDSAHGQQALGNNGVGGSGGGRSSLHMATSTPVKPASSIWADRKFLEDYEHCKARLSDLKFNIRRSYLGPGTPGYHPPLSKVNLIAN